MGISTPPHPGSCHTANDGMMKTIMEIFEEEKSFKTVHAEHSVTIADYDYDQDQEHDHT